MFDRVQILPNTLKDVKTCLNSTKEGGQTEKCFANQQCFSMFYRKTFTVWTGLSQRSSMLRASTIKTQNIHIIKTEALKYPAAAQNQGHHPEISITWNKNRKTRHFFLTFCCCGACKVSATKARNSTRYYVYSWKVQACIGVRTSRYFGRHLIFIKRKRREKKKGGFLFSPSHSSILISSETKTELASHTLDYGQASDEDDEYIV